MRLLSVKQTTNKTNKKNPHKITTRRSPREKAVWEDRDDVMLLLQVVRPGKVGSKGRRTEKFSTVRLAFKKSL